MHCAPCIVISALSFHRLHRPTTAYRTIAAPFRRTGIVAACLPGAWQQILRTMLSKEVDGLAALGIGAAAPSRNDREMTMYGLNDRSRWAGRAAALALSAAAVTCVVTTDHAAADTIKRGGTIVLARPEEPLSFNPYTQGDNGSIYAIVQVCDQLIEAGPTGTELKPGLAESWDVSPDGLTYTFKLRSAKFSDGSPVTIDDVVFSLNKLNDPSAAYQFLMKPVKTIEKVDDSHVKVTLKEPYAPFLSVMSVFASSIVKKSVFEASPDDFASKPVCSGPFKVQSYERGTKVVLVKNPNYWDVGADGQPLPYLDEVDLLNVPDT